MNCYNNIARLWLPVSLHLLGTRRRVIYLRESVSKDPRSKGDASPLPFYRGGYLAQAGIREDTQDVGGRWEGNGNGGREISREGYYQERSEARGGNYQKG
ncbi:MAG: hypothetical protein QXO75_11170, partial [Nitrososphaerota archaeon]